MPGQEKMLILWGFVRLKMMVPWIRSEFVLLGLLEPSSLQWAGRKYFLDWLGLDNHGLITCDCFPSRLENSLNSKLARSTMIIALWSITLLQKISHSFWFYVFLDNDDLCLIPWFLCWLLLILHFSCLLAICLIIPMSVIRSCPVYALVPYQYHPLYALVPYQYHPLLPWSRTSIILSCLGPVPVSSSLCLGPVPVSSSLASVL